MARRCGLLAASAALRGWLVCLPLMAFADSSQLLTDSQPYKEPLPASTLVSVRNSSVLNVAQRGIPGNVREPQKTTDLCTAPDRRTLSTIVAITTDRSANASAVVVADNRVLTAAHAVRGAGHFFVRLGEVYRSADLVKIDHGLDLAVLAVDTGPLEPLPILRIAPAPSAPVWAAGYPGAQAMALSRGEIKSAGNGVLNSSATIDLGQSGGGLLSCIHGNWFLAGMLRGFGVYQEGAHLIKVQHLSMSVAGAVIKDFLNQSP